MNAPSARDDDPDAHSLFLDSDQVASMIRCHFASLSEVSPSADCKFLNDMLATQGVQRKHVMTGCANFCRELMNTQGGVPDALRLLTALRAVGLETDRDVHIDVLAMADVARDCDAAAVVECKTWLLQNLQTVFAGPAIPGVIPECLTVGAETHVAQPGHKVDVQVVRQQL